MGQIKSGMSKPIIFQNDVEHLLDLFEADISDLDDLWDQSGRFLSPEELFHGLIDKKIQTPSVNEDAKKLADCCITFDQRSGAYTRYNFMYGLADLYAQRKNSDTAVVEFDIANAKGTSAVVGDEILQDIIKVCNNLFEKNLYKKGALSVHSYDNAKNDDLKLIVTGLRYPEIREALQDAEDEIADFVLVLNNIPHTKYEEEFRRGTGIGSGFCMLGRGLPMTDVQAELNGYVEKRKLETAQNRLHRRQVCQPVPLTNEQCKKVMSFKIAMENHVSYIKSLRPKPFPFSKNEASTPAATKEDPQKIREQVIQDKIQTAGTALQEARILVNLLRFYDEPEALTSARKDTLLLTDAQMIQEMHGSQDLLIANIKIENCAGINKILSLQHSERATQHFVQILNRVLEEELGANEHYTYYIGTNSFNILAPSTSEERLLDVLENSFKQAIDKEINARPIGEYFASIGISCPENSPFKDDLMRDIGHCRDKSMNGVSAINIHSQKFAPGFSEEDLYLFQNFARNGDRPSDRKFDDSQILKAPFIFAANPDAAFDNLQALSELFMKEEEKGNNVPPVQQNTGIIEQPPTIN